MHAAPAARPGLLHGRRGWTTVAALASALALLVGAQLSGAGAAQASGPAAVAGPQEQRDRPVAAVRAARAAGEAQARPPAPPAAVPAVATAPVPAAAPAAPAGTCSGEGWQQRRGAAALAALGPAAQGSGFRVEFAPARSGYLGLTYLQRGVVEIYVRDCGAQSDELLRHVVAHELGHAFDTVRMDDASRAAYQAARGIPAATSWYGCSGCSDFATPAGDFAEVYAQWLRGAGSNRSQLAGDAGPAQLQALAAEFFGA